MDMPYELVRPQTLEAGREYWLRAQQENEYAPALVPVRFIEYDPCPAFVIVSSGASLKRCARDDLFARD